MTPTRRALVLGAPALLLGGCTPFVPAYGPSGGAAGLRGAVRADDPDTEVGFHFVDRLEERLGRPAPGAPWALSYAFGFEQAALAIDGSNNITRFNLEGRVDWALGAPGAPAPRLSGTERDFTAYSATGSTISTLASQRDAERRLAILLADSVVARLLAEAPAP